MKEKRIVITGIGVLAPNGIGKDEFWGALKDGRSGIKPIKRFDTSEFRSKMAGEIDNFKAIDFLGPKGLKDLDRTSRLLCAAAKLAIDDAKLEINDSNTDDFGVCTGTTLSSLWNLVEYDRQVITDGPVFTDPAVFPGTVVNAASSYVSIRNNIQGFNTTISSDYTSSLCALKYALEFIKLGRVKAVLVGGAESLSKANFSAFYKTEFLSGIKGEELSCPFDMRRNGIILSEGAGVVVIEDEEYAKQRKAHIYAEIKGIGNYFNAYKMGKYQPQAKGLKRSIGIALENSNLRLTDIDYISAAANSVPIQDRLETEAIKETFGKAAYKIPVSSIKSMIGESFSAAGLFQIIASVGALKDNFLPATINHYEKDEACDLDYIPNTSRSKKVRNILINNFGPGGNNAAMVLSRYQN
jgi:3-oxoacyl-[acyl-carrier-protein] synthase II